MADEHDSLLREVQEEIRREQMEKIWQKYNGLIVAAAALIILSVAGYKYWETRRVAAEEQAGATFAAAENLSDDKKKTEAEAAFKKIADSGPAGYAALAKLQLAGAQAKAGKTADAVATFDSLAKDTRADNLLRSYAQLQAASLRLSDADYAEIQNRLKPLLGDDAPFDKSARELLGLAAFKAKKYDEARNYLEPLLVDPKAPQGLQARVKVVMADIASSEVASKTKPAAAAPAKDSAPEAKTGEKPAEADAKTTTGQAKGTAADTTKKP
ncbi:tetratricopeptide repeat protein [Hyphomicrobium sp.]|jgi:hypothetical protein|uniref:tetratricopeptide repeat protein n=1 Tax=Hyphomicrobium sp. TaxID=82 RepID=UPI002BCED81A|nr:tetratricopeptide repeat protein [Hyphomicrobium sp.]HVZ03854.1 tetratricopeptide repeat protein [Hyphomicrobium sp.]